MTSQPGKQTIAIHILQISQEVNAIRQWNLVSYENIPWETFFFNSYTKCGGETIRKTFSTKSKLSISLD